MTIRCGTGERCMRAFGPDIRGVCVLLLVSFCVSAVPGRLFADDDAKNEPVAKPAAAAKTEVPASETTQTAGTSEPILRTTPVTAATSSEGASSTTSVSGSTAVTSGSQSALADSTIGPAAPDEINAGLPNRSNDRSKKFPDTMAVIELLGKTLHLPMDGEEQGIDFVIVKNAGLFRQGRDRS